MCKTCQMTRLTLSYLDFLCPFSRKMAHSLNDNVVPLITKGGKYEGQVQLLVRPYPQPLYVFVYITHAD